MSDELKPCPWCGGVADTDVTPNACQKPYTVWCNACLCHGPERATREDAIAAWNRRAADVPRSGVLVPSDKLAEMQTEIAALRAERDALRAQLAALTREPDEAEVDHAAAAGMLACTGWYSGGLTPDDAMEFTRAAIAAWNTRAADADIAALRAERDDLFVLSETLKNNEKHLRDDLLNVTAQRDAHYREENRLEERIAALTREPDEAEVERVAKATVGDWDALAYYMQESYRILARAAIAAFIAGRKS